MRTFAFFLFLICGFLTFFSFKDFIHEIHFVNSPCSIVYVGEYENGYGLKCTYKEREKWVSLDNHEVLQFKIGDIKTTDTSYGILFLFFNIFFGSLFTICGFFGMFLKD